MFHLPKRIYCWEETCILVKISGKTWFQTTYAIIFQCFRNFFTIYNIYEGRQIPEHRTQQRPRHEHKDVNTLFFFFRRVGVI